MNRRSVMLLGGMLLVTSLTTGFSFGGWRNQVLEGNKNLKNGQVAESIEAYNQALVEEPDEGVIHYNLGHANYQEQNYEQAKEHFTKAMTYSEEKSLVNQAEYNLGNVAYREGEMKVQENPQEAMNLYETALHHYQQAMMVDANDRDSRINYEFVKKKLDELKDQMEEEQQNSDQNQQEENQEQNQEQKDKQQQDQQQENQSQNQDQQQQEQNQQGEQNQDQADQQQSQGQGQENEQNEEEQQDPAQQNQQNQQEQQEEGQDQQSAAGSEEQTGEAQQVGLTQEEALQLLEQFKDQDGEFIPIQPMSNQDSKSYKDW